MVLSTISIRQLEALSAIIEQLSEEDFRAELPLLEGTSIGKHIRHTLEFHQCLFAEKKVVSYDDRDRNVSLETDRQAAMNCIDGLISRLRFVQLDKVIHLSVQYGSETIIVTSSVKREMAFLIEHTVHHKAILRMALNQYFPQVQFDPSFGYADSTIRFLEQTKVAI
ncbi:MAG TPA: hypothetical protein VK151_17010 [Fluviicola sp.]|nr:hypothetical protein [Fluviicola sp.]